MDHSARYQLLDHATDEAPLWDTRHGIQETRADGQRVDLHRERPPAELRPELERLLRDGHVVLYEMTSPEHRVLALEEALGAIADERNWFTPLELGTHGRRPTIYALSLTESGSAEFRLERTRTDES